MVKMNKKIICLCPVKNEAWILDIFLASTSLWADHIIMLDQNSTDESRLIIQRFSKAILVENNSNNYNELERQRILINHARDLFGNNNILFALDADEILANYHNNPDWYKLLELKPGTTIRFPWLNVLPGNDTYFESAGKRNIFAYIDDGAEHIGMEMHSPRVPVYTEPIDVDSIKVLHYQFSVRGRQLSKHRWYECLESIKYPDKDKINVYRTYHHIDLPPGEVHEIPQSWYINYELYGINLRDIKDDGQHWWDKELCALLLDKGPARFRKEAIWYIDWNEVHQRYFKSKSPVNLNDPRSVLDKLAHIWLKASQSNPTIFSNRVVAKFLRVIHW